MRKRILEGRKGAPWPAILIGLAVVTVLGIAVAGPHAAPPPAKAAAPVEDPAIKTAEDAALVLEQQLGRKLTDDELRRLLVMAKKEQRR